MSTLAGILTTVALVCLLVGIVVGFLVSQLRSAERVIDLQRECQTLRNEMALRSGQRPALVGSRGVHRVDTPPNGLPVYAFQARNLPAVPIELGER